MDFLFFFTFFFPSKCDISEWLVTAKMATTESNVEMLSLRHLQMVLFDTMRFVALHTHPPTTTLRPPIPSPTGVGSMHDSSLTVSCDGSRSLPPTSIQGCTGTAPRRSISTGGRGGEFPFKVPDELPLTVTSLTGWGRGCCGRTGNRGTRVLWKRAASTIKNKWLGGSRKGRKKESYDVDTHLV